MTAVDLLYASRGLKETSAVNSNQREDKILQRRHQTLGLEQMYSVKLMEIDERMLKIRFKKLKDRVAKIKSHLSHDEIAEINEEEFQLLASHRNRSGTLDSEGSSGADSDKKEPNKVSFAPRRKAVTPEPTRKRSLHGRATQSARRNRSSTPLVPLPTSRGNRPRSMTNPTTTVTEAWENSAPSRKSTPRLGRDHRDGVSSASSFHRAGSSVSMPRLTSSSVLQPTSITAHTGDQFGFDSHFFAERSRSANGAQSARRISSSGAQHSDMAISDTYARLVEEQRLMLIDENMILASELEERKLEFLQKVDELVARDRDHEAKPFATKKQPVVSTELTAAKIEELRRKIREDKAHRLRHRFDRKISLGLERKDDESDEEYSRRIQEYVRELRKCRYLRIPKELEDITGVVTLVRDQTRVQGVWRKSISHHLF